MQNADKNEFSCYRSINSVLYLSELSVFYMIYIFIVFVSVVFVMLINVRMATIAGILTFISMTNAQLS